MSFGGRSQMRQHLLRRGSIVSGVLVLLAVIFFLSGHWILGLIFGVPAVAAVWALLQARSVR